VGYTDLKTEDKVFLSFAAFMDLLSLCSKEPHRFSELRDFQYVSTFTNGGFAGEPNDEFYDLILFRSNGFPKLKVSLSLDDFEYLNVSFWTYNRGVSSDETNFLLPLTKLGSYGNWDESKLLIYLRAFETVVSKELESSFGIGVGFDSLFVKLAHALGFDRDTIIREAATIAYYLGQYNEKVLRGLGSFKAE
jgi:hypothetical protein